MSTPTLLDDPSPPARKPPLPPPPVRLGEELPVFCEKCGYSLHGLKAVRCEHCRILHFACPECGHHQPINTLRPALQRLLGRARAWALFGIVFFKINYFFWLLVAWFAMGVEFIYRGVSVQGGYRFAVRALNIESVVCFFALAVGYAMVGRMLLLRWRRGLRVGLVLAGLAWAAVTLGAWMTHAFDRGYYIEPLSTSVTFLLLAAWTSVTIVISSMIVWPIWVGLVRVFLPRDAGQSLLEWQRGGSDRTTSALARE